MAGYRYWRITNIRPRLEVPWISADYVSFVNNKNISLTSANLTISATASGTKASNILAQDTTYWAWDNNIEVKANISYDFGTPVEVTAIKLRMRQNMQPGLGQEWQEAVIQCSEDKINWIFYGIILPKINQMDLTLKTVPIYTESQIITNSGGSTGSYWWNTYPDSCIFAIDSSSTKVSETVLLSSDKKNILIAEKNKNNTFNKRMVSAFIETNFRYDLNYTYKYNSLNISKNNLIFKSVFTIPSEFTFILKCKVNSNSVFLNKSSSTDNYGLVLEMSQVNPSPLSYNWRVASTITGEDYPEDNKKGSLKGIETVILKGSTIEKTGSIMTNYGTYPIQLDSFSSFFNKAISVLGSTSSSINDWGLDADIIAYGLFNKNFSNEELQNILTEIDTEFLVEKVKTKTQPLLLSSEKYHQSKDKVVKNNLFKTTSVPYYSQVAFKNFSSRLLSDDLLSDSLIINNVTNIEDYVYEEGRPVKVRLYLYERHSGQLISKVWSNLDGYFEFVNLDSNLDYVVTAHDPKYQFRSIIKNYNKR